ncbi:DUF2635 domain-containing protein [Citrobacter freundii]|uniref:DUF2635 domain-containing protein n=1 Tax=Citrobacter freundii TaxID=546 RepID=A0A7W3H9I0_CITFR|nr:DUF2635 domain-containing protein [Citrobacter freundii]MBA8062342.1 DUF2635 domain-containing protein [Citrobacter freundii]
MKKNIKPARDGLLVRKNKGEHLKAEGEVLLMSAWWHRREAEGDVVITDVKEPATEVAQALQNKNVKEK